MKMRPEHWAALVAGIVGFQFSFLKTVQDENAYLGEGLVKMTTVFCLVYAGMAVLSRLRGSKAAGVVEATRAKMKERQDREPDEAETESRASIDEDVIRQLASEHKRPVEIVAENGSRAILVIGLLDSAPVNTLREFVDVEKRTDGSVPEEAIETDDGLIVRIREAS